MLNTSDTNFHEDQSMSILACECIKEQSLPLVQVMGIGLKNKMDDLMHTLNDINSRMILDDFQSDEDLVEVPILDMERTERFQNIKPLHQAIRTCWVW